MNREQEWRQGKFREQDELRGWWVGIRKFKEVDRWIGWWECKDCGSRVIGCLTGSGPVSFSCLLFLPALLFSWLWSEEGRWKREHVFHIVDGKGPVVFKWMSLLVWNITFLNLHPLSAWYPSDANLSCNRYFKTFNTLYSLSKLLLNKWFVFICGYVNPFTYLS